MTNLATNTANKLANASLTRTLTVFPFMIWVLYKGFVYGAEKVPIVGMTANAYDTVFTSALETGPRGLQYLQACPSGDIPCYIRTVTHGVPCTKTGEGFAKKEHRPKNFHWCNPPAKNAVDSLLDDNGLYENMMGQKVQLPGVGQTAYGKATGV